MSMDVKGTGEGEPMMEINMTPLIDVMLVLITLLIITLPIPLGHMVPGAAISILALGLIERDGLVIGLGLVIATFGLAIVTVASGSVAAAVRAWLAI